jgi:hypothetical protein
MYTLQAKGREMNQFFTMAVTSSELAFLYTQYISLWAYDQTVPLKLLSIDDPYALQSLTGFEWLYDYRNTCFLGILHLLVAFPLVAACSTSQLNL